MTAREFLDKADNFRGTAFVAFDLGDRIMAIGRRVEDGPICLYERDREAEPKGYRRTLATFDSAFNAARAGSFIGSMGEMLS